MLDNYWISTQKLALIKGVSARAGRVQFFAPQYNAQRGKTIKFSFHLALFIKLQVKYNPFYIKTGEIFFPYRLLSCFRGALQETPTYKLCLYKVFFYLKIA